MLEAEMRIQRYLLTDNSIIKTVDITECFGIANSISCCSSSLVECPPEVREVGGSHPGRDMSVSGALLKDGDELGEVSPLDHYFSFPERTLCSSKQEIS
jgi:hypothetical protein